mmetsp:Transcript_15227/g.29347  ORF Transcript_15227/g.29347 Transcript_15227/m.29347 type:complete len:207 (-) Transcript_15227:276-896(-)
MIALAKGLVTSWGAVVVMGVPKMIMSLTRDGHVPAMVAYTLGWVLAGLVLGVLVPRSLLPWGKPRGNLKKLINMLDADGSGTLSKAEFDVLQEAVSTHAHVFQKAVRARAITGGRERWKLRRIYAVAAGYLLLAAYALRLAGWVSGEGSAGVMRKLLGSYLGLAGLGLAVLPLGALARRAQVANSRLRNIKAAAAAITAEKEAKHQ